MRKLSYFYLIFILVILFIQGCATVPERIASYPETQLLKHLCEYHQIDWQWDSVSQIVTLRREGLDARVMVGSNMVVLGNESIALSKPVRRVQNAIVVPPDFEYKIIKRLTVRKVPSLKKYKTIIVDAGHGGKDPGAIGITGAREKVIVLDIAQRLKNVLEKQGIKVIMTRDDDRFLTLEERTEKASRYNADLFVSIHANSSTSKRPQGTEVYYAKDMRKEAEAEDQVQKNQQILFKKLNMKENIPEVTHIVSNMLYAHKQEESKDLAWHVASKLSRDIGLRNRGSMEAGYFVLRNTLIPAILVEVGYLSSRREENLLRGPGFRQKVAEAIAEAITSYE